MPDVDESSSNNDELLPSGRSWKELKESIEFEKPGPLFDQPMEITVQMLRGLRMVDETVVVHGHPTQISEKQGSES